MERVYGGDHLGLARVGARIYDLKAKGHEIVSWKDKAVASLHWYQMRVSAKPHIEVVEMDGRRIARLVA